jgi:pSer/pThr/pTyr-binding forkhead associated (FHA) protein
MGYDDDHDDLCQGAGSGYDTTKSDPLLAEQVLTDDVRQLRVWGTTAVRPLDPEDTVKRVIGSAPGTWLRIRDFKDKSVSREHAEVIYDRERKRWLLRDLGSTNGTFTGGVRYGEIVLEPGMEIKLGRIPLVAESNRFASTRAFLARILGRSPEQNTAVEAAVRALRLAATHRKEIVLCGNDDMVLLARSLHRRFLGADRPFVVCDPSREAVGEENVRSAASYPTGLEALQAARGGSVCVKNSPRPPDFERLRVAMQDPDVRSHLFICIRRAKDASAFDTTAIILPPIKKRKDELRQVIQEYAVDAMAEMKVPISSFRRADVEWVLANESDQLADIEKATRRLVALRVSEGNMSKAAAMIGMARMSLRKWIRNRRLPITLVEDDDDGR